MLAVAYSTVTVPDAARLKETSNSTAASAPSLALASAADTPGTKTAPDGVVTDTVTGHVFPLFVKSRTRRL